jgi:hypothetical protein
MFARPLSNDAFSPSVPANRPMPATSIKIIDEPMPLHHVSVIKGFDDMREGFTARVLYLRRADGTVEHFLPFTMYQRFYRRRSAAWQDTPARALGLFWDFCIEHAASGLSPYDLFREFAYALLEGTNASPTRHCSLSTRRR